MPTNRQRYVLTETDELAAALDVAAERWPEDAQSRSQLLRRLVQMGEEALREDLERGRTRRRAAVARTQGQFRGVYGPGYVEQLRDEWPD